MQKTANLLLLILVFLFFSMEPAVVSSSFTKERIMKVGEQKCAKTLVDMELARKAYIEQTMYDSLVTHSARWVKTGFSLEQISIESGGNQNAISPEGAQGIAQFLPSTWEALKRHKLIPEWFVIGNETHQRIAQLIYLNFLYDSWYDQPVHERKALTAASYNAGIGVIKNLVKLYGSEWRNYLPEETVKYLNLLKNYV